MKRLLLLPLLLSFPMLGFAQESTCFGTTADGRLENGVQLPAKGKNFVGYSHLAKSMGRTFVHSAVKSIILDSYKNLESNSAGKIFKYAETGKKHGGEFSPHKTHQNGLSVDFMVPVIDKKGKSVHLPTHPLNKFGYNIEFDKVGHYKNLSIDYEAMGAHIVELHKSATAKGYELWRVIFDPELQPFLMKSSQSEYLKKHIQFSRKKSWVRHDEHYHVDFLIPCKK